MWSGLPSAANPTPGKASVLGSTAVQPGATLHIGFAQVPPAQPLLPVRGVNMAPELLPAPLLDAAPDPLPELAPPLLVPPLLVPPLLVPPLLVPPLLVPPLLVPP